MTVLCCCTGKTKLQLSAPVCIAQGQRVAISRKVGEQWRLAGYGDLRRGTAVGIKLPPGYDAALEQASSTPAAASVVPPPPAPAALAPASSTVAPPPLPAASSSPQAATPEELGEDSPGVASGAGAGAGAGADASSIHSGACDYEALLARLRATLEKRHGSLLNSKRVQVPPLKMFRWVGQCQRPAPCCATYNA